MPRKTNIQIGQTIGKLTVKKRLGTNSKKDVEWLCECECGNERIVTTRDLNRRNKIISCGCYWHGERRTRLYETWANMKQRCYNPNNSAYSYYGGKNIQICEEWLNDFTIFHEWAINNGYQDDLTIDRIDAEKDYEPDNCRWATRKEQTINRRATLSIDIDGVKYTTEELSQKYDINQKLIQERYRNGKRGNDLIKPSKRK